MQREPLRGLTRMEERRHIELHLAKTKDMLKLYLPVTPNVTLFRNMVRTVIILYVFGFFFTYYLFIYSWETQRERQRHRQREGEAGSMQGARRGTRSQVSRITPWAAGGAKPLWHQGCPCWLPLRILQKLHIFSPRGKKKHYSQIHKIFRSSRRYINLRFKAPELEQTFLGSLGGSVVLRHLQPRAWS